MSFENRNYAFAGVFVDELARCGLKHVCICPGSRSSPLAISFARRTEIKKWVHLDERSAAFFALGIAKYSRQTVALVCSSGTAAANFSPAVIEAFYSGVPLLVLTADRPPELHDWGALQTINQATLYDGHVKWSAAMPTPELTNGLLAFVRSAACRAFSTAADSPAGPVHLNFFFREPLEPALVPADFPPEIDRGLLERDGDRPFLEIASSPNLSPDNRDIERLATEITGKRSVIVCGPDCGENIAPGVTRLASRLHSPVLADCLSGVRCGRHNTTQVIDSYDLFVNDKDFDKTRPEVIIRLGALPVSKPLSAYLDTQRQARQILIDPGRRWRNPSHVQAEVWHVDESNFCSMLAKAVKSRTINSDWNNYWRDANSNVRKSVTAKLTGQKEMFEGKIFDKLAGILPEDSLLFAGNSMPIRDMDTFFPSSNRRIRFMANRGASGIDGVTSTALGVSAVAQGRMVLVLGDVSFYHDMNGLLAAKEFGLGATIIVINNDGGGIFSFLPQSASNDVFETYFGTPHGMTFRRAAEQYGLDYESAGTWAKLESGIKASFKSKRTTIIEIKGNREQNLSLHREIRKYAIAGLNRTGRRSR